jgi:hypothetical protein
MECLPGALARNGPSTFGSADKGATPSVALPRAGRYSDTADDTLAIAETRMGGLAMVSHDQCLWHGQQA